MTPIQVSPWLVALAVLGWFFWVSVVAILAKLLEVVFDKVLPGDPETK